MLRATVERWEREHTEKVIELVEAQQKRALIAFSLYLGQVQMYVSLPGLVEPVLDEAVQVLAAKDQAAVAHNA